MAKLKPCPICHGERIKKRYAKPWGIVKCKDCGYFICDTDTYEEADGLKEAIREWNRRAEDEVSD